MAHYTQVDVGAPLLSSKTLLSALPSDSNQPSGGDRFALQRVVVVQPVGDPAASGAALRAALAGAAADAGARCLIKVAPGVYDLGTAPLQMRAHVDIAGAGERDTMLMAQIDSIVAGVVVGADDAELSGMTVSNTGGATYAVAIYNDGVAPRLSHVIANAVGARGNYGVYNCNGAAPIMTHVAASASGGSCNTGIYNDGAAPIMTHVAASAAGGQMSYGIYNFDGAAPTLTDVIATAAGADRNVGLYNEESYPTLTDVIAYASGGVHNLDVFNG